MPRVRFIDVGRGHVTWEADLHNVDEASLVREIRRKGVLMSRTVEVVGGEILVGGWRGVGRVELVEDLGHGDWRPPWTTS